VCVCVCVAGVSGSRLGMEQVGEPEQACEERGSGRERSSPALQAQMDKLAGSASLCIQLNGRIV
jgi:hypothetical protein